MVNIKIHIVLYTEKKNTTYECETEILNKIPNFLKEKKNIVRYSIKKGTLFQ